MEIIPSANGIKGRVADVDAKHVDPSRRAQYLYAKLIALEPQPTMWDMVCFASELIAMTSLMEPAFVDVAKKLAAITYEIHYIHGTNLESCLPPISPSLTTFSETGDSKNSPEKVGPLHFVQSMELTDL